MKGDFQVRFREKFEVKFLLLTRLSVRYIGGVGLEMALSSTSGDVSVACGGINNKGKKKVQESFGAPDSKVKASTISGDIKVRDC